MTNGELIRTLQQFPESDEVDWMLFSNLTPRRCDVHESNVMIRRNHHMGRTCIMLNLEKYWEDDLTDSYEKMKKLHAEWEAEKKRMGI